ncbi:MULTISPECIES: DKNYY domain-containing protein [Eikenella]|uniref:DKNYY family protein n=1 Tax=Eikenella longinqua TaxID=1795827 RepID=A0A1A9RYM6_9NEIS|nr:MULTISPECIES: DKNYY domain-containing protein [Eikenella]OAM29283.1 hypothetical protein A7P95_03460 [Eikenella longinqua]
MPKPAAQKPPFIGHNINPHDLDWDIGTDPRFYLADTQEIAGYWTNGKQVFYRYRPIKKANPETFIYFNSLFAQDDKHCYIMWRKLKGAKPDHFHVLNECYATDYQAIWATNRRLELADGQTFEVCDQGLAKFDFSHNWDWHREFTDGIKRIVLTPVPAGYAKDSRQVYYNFDGRIKILPKADPATFVSMNDGIFAKDERHVFHEARILPGANPATWQKLTHDYSKDDKRIYYQNKPLKAADHDTFQVVQLTRPQGYDWAYGKDKNQYYCNGEAMTEAEAWESADTFASILAPNVFR